MPMSGEIPLPVEGEVSLYFHIPFCTRKCSYCHFYVIPNKDPFKQQLMHGLELEWKRSLPMLQGNKIATIYFGGGTPALIGPHAIAQVLEMVASTMPFTETPPEITLEANPEDVTPQLMRDYASAGINRVSIGVQTLDNALLQVLGRIHNAQKALEAVQHTAAAGIDNISIDLIYDLPGQTLESWKNSLEGISGLPITHLSLYNLTIEPQTVFFKYRKEIEKQLPSHDVSLQMYEMAIDLLPTRHLKQYEISAFAKDNAYSHHNVGYWIGRPFLGFGPSAFSYWQGKRFRNVAHLGKYCRALDEGHTPIDFEEQLPDAERRRELFVIQLRLLCGVDLAAFEQRHGKLDEETYATLQHLCNQGLITNKDNAFRLTRKGLFLYDTIATELI